MDRNICAGSFQMPRLGLGTLRNREDEARQLVERALAEGYRHIDTAEYYGNEEPVGRAIARSSVPRDQIWLTTKILHPKAPPAPDVRTAAESSLRRLGVEYVDAMLIHWPDPDTFEEALVALAGLRDEGSLRTIGVSNFPSAMVQRAVEVVDDLAVLQVEYHVYLDQRALREAVQEHDLALIAHSPLALGRVIDDPTLIEIARDRGLTAAQVALRWLIEQDRVAAVPGGRPDHVDHLRENLEVLDLTPLTDEERRRIATLADGTRVVDPPHGPEWDT